MCDECVALRREIESYRARDEKFIDKNGWRFKTDTGAWGKWAWVMPRRKLIELLDYWRNQHTPANVERRLRHLKERLHHLAQKYQRLHRHAHTFNEGLIRYYREEIVELRERLAKYERPETKRGD